eukprot:CAMPEP_0171347236 /NCGR_PEP_ID=MMETSP0878-20121228/27306_1 /TAXON_ID=67004 /ORGANISM="Thalassiosira weissflogii, Strain CCMP1336" /LENGTH=1035 /DNA_ID=CAMNT_0011851199 /DNA_START=170 /DNA_END=3277 /DNA_ORIENTATION=-
MSYSNRGSSFNNNYVGSNNPNNNNGINNSNSSNTPRKYAIKPFRSFAQMDTPTALKTFKSLAAAMDEIHNRNASTLSFEELYRNAYNLVLHKHGNLLYEGVWERLEFHLVRCAGKLVKRARDLGLGGSDLIMGGSAGAAASSSSSASSFAAAAGGTASANSSNELTNPAAATNSSSSVLGYKLLEELSKSWTEHRITMVMVRDIFMYMDRTYVPLHKRRPVYDLGLWLFRRVVWERRMDDLTGCDEYDYCAATNGNDYRNDYDYGNSHDDAKGNLKSPPELQFQQMQQQAGEPQMMQSQMTQTLGNVTSSLLLQVIHQDRLDRLEDAPQRMTLLRCMIGMLIELEASGNGSFNDSMMANNGTGRDNYGSRRNFNASSGTTNTIPVYQRDFEEAFLGETQDFYRMESASRLSHAGGLSGNNNDVNDIDGENNLALNFNSSSSGKPPAKYSAMEYVQRAKIRLDQERDRATTLALPEPTRTALLRIVETELIERHAKTLVDMEGSGFASILKVVASSPVGAGKGGGESGVVIDHNRVADLAAMYDLFSRVPSSVNHLRDALSERIRLDGRALVRDQETNSAPPSAFVKGVLAMRERFDAVVTDAMRGEKKAQKRMREAFEDFLNADARAANCLAVYVDELLRIGLKGADERKVEMELDRVIVIFRYLSDKDVFEAYYKNHLAKRLLGNKSGSEEAERAMVSLLKAECGYQFTSKLEGMFNDMRISKETAEKYRAYKKKEANSPSPPLIDLRDAENGGKPVDVEVSVLTTGYWPSQNVAPCTLPPPVKAAMDRFQKYYLTTYTGRKLSWQTSTGSAEIRATFPPIKGSSKVRRHDLSVTTYQMCILVLFNNRDVLTLAQIRNETNIPEDELRRHLVSLCTPKHRILRKGSKGKGISNDDDTFTYNAEYTSKMTRVKVPMVSMRDATLTSSAEGTASAAGAASSSAAASASRSGLVDGSATVPVQVEEDRRHLLEAAIVRIMKARKTLNHNDLVAEVTRQLSGRFVPPPQFVKKRVESLIEREYLERDESDRRVYKYMA